MWEIIVMQRDAYSELPKQRTRDKPKKKKKYDMLTWIFFRECSLNFSFIALDM